MTVKMMGVYSARHVPTLTPQHLLSYTLTILFKIVHTFSRVLSIVILSPSRRNHQRDKRYLQTYGTRCSELQGPERVHSSLKGRTTNNSTGQTPMPVSRKESMPTDEHAETFKPVTLTYNWFTFEGFLQRFTFALTMSLAAVVVSAFLWMISLPWFAWSLQLWFYRWVQSHVRRTFYRTSTSANGYRIRDAERVPPTTPNMRNAANATCLD